MDGHSKREVLEIFNMNWKNKMFFPISFRKLATNWSVIYDF